MALLNTGSTIPFSFQLPTFSGLLNTNNAFQPSMQAYSYDASGNLQPYNPNDFSGKKFNATAPLENYLSPWPQGREVTLQEMYGVAPPPRSLTSPWDTAPQQQLNNYTNVYGEQFTTPQQVNLSRFSSSPSGALPLYMNQDISNILATALGY